MKPKDTDRSDPSDHEDRQKKLLKLLLYAYPDRVTLRRESDPSRGLMVGGRGVVLEPASVVRKAPLFLSIDPRDAGGGFGAGSGVESRVSLASAVEAPWLEEVFPHLLERRLLHRFDPERGRVMSLRQTLFAGLVVREDPAGGKADPQGVREALFDYLRRDVEGLFAGDEETGRWLGRVAFLRRFMPELELPEFDRAALEEALHEGLGGALAGCRSPEQIRARGLRRLLEERLSWKQRAALEEHAPEALAVPSGSRIRLKYGEDGSAPVLAVRLQELFGWAETPRLAAGRAPVVLHLLGPNYRPVQVTSDLKSFWNTLYAEVRRDLRARYPKHPWPEDPWNAPPVAVGRRRR